MNATEMKTLATQLQDIARLGQPDSPFRCIGVGQAGIAQGLERISRQTTRRVLNSQLTLSPRSSRLALPANRRSRELGLDMRVLTRPETVDDFPLLAALDYPLRVGRVAQQMIVADERVLVLPGAHDVEGKPTAWFTTDPTTVAKALELWNAMWVAARPVPRLELTDRQIELIFEAAEGCTDDALARRHGLSRRTITSELTKAAAVFGVSGKAELIGSAFGLMGSKAPPRE